MDWVISIRASLVPDLTLGWYPLCTLAFCLVSGTFYFIRSLRTQVQVNFIKVMLRLTSAMVKLAEELE